MEAVRTYGHALAVLVVTARRAHTDAPGAAATLDIGEEIGPRAVVNRAVAGLPTEYGLVAVTAAGVTWGPGALDTLRAAAARRPRAGLLGPPPVACAGGGGRASGTAPWLDGAAVLLRRAAWDSVDGYDTRIDGSIDTPLGRSPHPADVDLGARLARAGWLVVGVPGVEVVVPPVGGPGMLIA